MGYMVKKMKNNQPSHIKNTRNVLIISNCLILAAVIAIAFYMMFTKMTESKDKNISGMTSFASSLLKERMIDYMEMTEKSCEGFFRCEHKHFYPDESTMDIAEIHKQQDEISAELLELSLGDYYADFGIAYDDGSTAGIITDSSRDAFGGDVYGGLSSFLRGSKDENWGTGYKGNFEKLYYVKRVNDHAIMTVSLYALEVERRMKDVTGLSEASSIIIDRDGNIIFSADSEAKSMTGQHIDNDLLALLTDVENITISNDEYYIATDDINSDWRTVCYFSKANFREGTKRQSLSLIAIGFGAMALSSLISLFITRKLSSAALAQLYATGLDGVDRLTKLTNKFSTEDMIIETLESSPMGSCYGLVLIDIDNLKDINDHLGRTAGDDTIIRVSALIRSVFGESAVIGRLGGDKFEMLADVTDFDLFKCLSTLEHKCAELCESLNSTYADDDRKYKIAVSVGAALYPLSSDTYEGLLNNADEALRTSKQKGGGCFTVYRRTDSKKDGEDR